MWCSPAKPGNTGGSTKVPGAGCRAHLGLRLGVIRAVAGADSELDGHGRQFTGGGPAAAVPVVQQIYEGCLGVECGQDVARLGAYGVLDTTWSVQGPRPVRPWRTAGRFERHGLRARPQRTARWNPRRAGTTARPPMSVSSPPRCVVRRLVTDPPDAPERDLAMVDASAILVGRRRADVRISSAAR